MDEVYVRLGLRGFGGANVSRKDTIKGTVLSVYKSPLSVSVRGPNGDHEDVCRK